MKRKSMFITLIIAFSLFTLTATATATNYWPVAKTNVYMGTGLAGYRTPERPGHQGVDMFPEGPIIAHQSGI